MSNESFKMYADDPDNRPTQPKALEGAYRAVDIGVREITKKVDELASIPEVLATDAPAAYAARAMPLIREIRQRAEKMGRMVADEQLARLRGRGRRTGALTLDEIAEGLGVSRSTVTRWRQAGPIREYEVGESYDF